MSKFFHTLFFLSITSIFGQNIVLDNSFGNNGILELPFESSIVYGNSTAGGFAKSKILDNGKILVLKGGQINGISKGYLIRITSNGTIDTTFGDNGFVFFDNNTTYQYAIKIQNDNKIVVFGGHNPVKIYRFLENGQADLGFGDNGLVQVTNVNNSYAHDTYGYGGERHNLILLQDGKILIKYKYQTFTTVSSSGYKIKCFNSDGSPNISFGNNSELTQSNNSQIFDFFSEFLFNSSDNKILGYGSFSGGYFLEKFNLDGTKDLSFGINGAIQFTLPYTNFITNSITQVPNNKFLIQSFYEENSLIKMRQIRIDEQGNLDISYGNQGINEETTFQNILISEPFVYNDNYYSTGGILDSSQNLQDLLIIDYNNNGSLNTNFNSTGYYSEITNDITDYGDNIFVQNDGKILVVGSYKINSTTRKFFIKRYVNNTLANKDFTFADVHFQNPISENIKFTSKKAIKKIEIFNSFGQKIIESKSTTIIFSHFPKGIYLANIEFDDNTFTSKKLIKN